MRDDSLSWAFTVIYGPQARVDKLRMLEELGRVRDGWPDPWCLGGILMRFFMPLREELAFAL